MQFCDRHVCSFQYAATRRLQLRAWPILRIGLRPVQLFLVSDSSTVKLTWLLLIAGLLFFSFFVYAVISY